MCCLLSVNRRGNFRKWEFFFRFFRWVGVFVFFSKVLCRGLGSRSAFARFRFFYFMYIFWGGGSFNHFFCFFLSFYVKARKWRGRKKAVWVWPFALDKKEQKRGSNALWFVQKRKFFWLRKEKKEEITCFFLFLIKEESGVCYAEYFFVY